MQIIVQSVCVEISSEFLPELNAVLVKGEVLKERYQQATESYVKERTGKKLQLREISVVETQLQ